MVEKNVVELEIGKKYSTKELAAALDMSYGNFRNKKNEVLKNLAIYYTYEPEYKGRATFYNIIEKKEDYKKLERKNARLKTDEVIKEFINEVLEEDPL